MRIQTYSFYRKLLENILQQMRESIHDCQLQRLQEWRDLPQAGGKGKSQRNSEKYTLNDSCATNPNQSSLEQRGGGILQENNRIDRLSDMFEHLKNIDIREIWWSRYKNFS